MRKKFQNFFKKVTENNILKNWRCATIKKSKNKQTCALPISDMFFPLQLLRCAGFMLPSRFVEEGEEEAREKEQLEKAAEA